MNVELAAYLKKHEGFIPVDEFGSAVGIPRGKLFSEVEKLIDEGYQIEFHPYFGLRLLDIPDRLLEHEIRDDLNTRTVGRKLAIHEVVASTNETAWEMVRSDPGLPDGTVVLAEGQSKGRGRMGSEWSSPAGLGLWLSIVCKVSMPPDRVGLLTSGASLAVANMLQQFIQLPAEIKWPNDVMIRGRKVAGILAEARSDLPDIYVVGIGLNVNQTADDFPKELQGIATSLRLERPGKAALNRVRVLRPLLFYFDRVYDLIVRRKFDKVARAWAGLVTMKGRSVQLNEGDNIYRGTVLAVDPSKGITLRLKDDETRTFSPESVSRVRETSEEKIRPEASGADSR